jgi:hypothetical protein
MITKAFATKRYDNMKLQNVQSISAAECSIQLCLGNTPRPEQFNPMSREAQDSKINYLIFQCRQNAIETMKR